MTTPMQIGCEKFPHFDPWMCLKVVREDQHGFLTPANVERLAAHPDTRLLQVLVRCGGCRFVCATQDVRHMIALVESGHDEENGCFGGDYVRDVSLLAEKPKAKPLAEALCSMLNIEGAATQGGKFAAWMGLDIPWHFRKARLALRDYRNAGGTID